MKNSSKFLSALFLLFAFNFTKAQNAIYGLPTTPCSSAAVAYQFGLYTPVPGAIFYTWQISNGGSPQIFTVSAPSGTTIVTTLAPGTYSIAMLPFAGTFAVPILLNTAIVSMTINIVPALNVTISSSALSNVCAGTSVTLAASGANSYTWSNSSTADSIVVNPTSNTNYSVFGQSAGGCIGSSTISVNITNIAPVITLNQPSSFTACAGSANLSASGALSYTWSWPGGSATTPAITPTAVGCYIVTGSNGSACPTSSTVACLSSISPQPTAAIIASSPVACVGSPVVFTATGASSYSWNVSYSNSANFTSNSNPLTITPTVSGATCLTVTAFNSGGCWDNASFCFSTQAIFPLGISGPVQTCSGASITLTAFGLGASTFSWSNGSTSSYIVVAPNANTCYSVAGSNGLCNFLPAATCVTVNSGPAITIAASNATVCAGSSVSFTAFGATSYTWVGGPSSSNYSLMPSSTAVYTVGSYGTNGCMGYGYATVVVDTTCSNVWPGDANNDGVVSTADILELGLAANSTGTSRSPGGNTYVSQYATNWNGYVSTGKNKCHADCNGDGTVDNADTLAIYNNMSLTHSFRPAPATDPDLRLVSATADAFVNVWNRVDVDFGSSVAPSMNLLGLGFELNFDNSLIVPDSIYLVFPASSLNANAVTYNLRKKEFSAGKIFAASVRSNQTDATVTGNIASIYFKVSNSAGEGDLLSLNITNANFLNKTGQSGALIGGDIDLPISRSVGLKELQLQNAFSVYPNPTKNMIRIVSENKALKDFRILDVTGRELMNGQLNNDQQIDVSSLSTGIYFIELQGAAGTSLKKIVIEE